MPLEKCLKISDAPADFDPVVWMAMALLSGETGKLPLFGQFGSLSAGDGVGTQGPKKIRVKHGKNETLKME